MSGDPQKYEFLTLKQVCSLLGIDPATWYRMMSRGTAAPFYKIGGRRLWRENDLEEWIEAQRVDGGKRSAGAGA